MEPELGRGERERASPLVSVVVPVYNGARTIDACLRSLLALRYPPEDLELIVVDNASTDDTGDVVERFGGRLRVLREEKRGAAAARNRGIAAARGHLIAFTDADCVVDPDWLTHLLPALEHPRVGIVGGRIKVEAPVPWIARFMEKVHDHDRALTRTVPPYASTANWASRRAVLVGTGRFDERFLRGQDAELAYRIYRAGYDLVYEPAAVVCHRDVDTVAALFRKGYQHGSCAVLLERTHGDLLGRARPRVLDRSLYRRLRRHGARWVRGSQRADAFCHLVFDLGKLAGRILGALRLSRARPPACGS